MTVRIRLFASLRERLGASELIRNVAQGCTAGDLMASLREEFPRLAGAGRVAIAVNAEYVDGGHVLAEGDEIALIPPVSGGCLRAGAPE